MDKNTKTAAGNSTAPTRKVASRSSRRTRTGAPRTFSDLSPNSEVSLAEQGTTKPLLSPSTIKDNERAVGSSAGTRALMNRWYLGITQKIRDTTRKQRQQSRRNDHRHSHHHHQSLDDSIRVQVPMRMMLSTLTIFLVLPLTIFIWKEIHLHPREGAEYFKSGVRQGPERNDPDRFPTWMDKLPFDGTNETSITDRLQNTDSFDNEEETTQNITSLAVVRLEGNQNVTETKSNHVPADVVGASNTQDRSQSTPDEKHVANLNTEKQTGTEEQRQDQAASSSNGAEPPGHQPHNDESDNWNRENESKSGDRYLR